MSEQLKPELRFPEFDGENNFYNKTSFKDIFDFSTGKNIKQNEASPEFDIPCVRYGELYHMYNEVIDEVINYTNLEKSELHFSEGDEILLPSAGEDPLDIGSASALILPNVAIGRTINILKPKEENTISSVYASYYINQVLKRKISTFAKGFSISNVYNSDLKRLSINLPVFLEQQKIANFLKAIDKRIKLLKAKKDALEDYKTSIMQKLFSQEVRFKQNDGSDFPEWEEKAIFQIANKTSSNIAANSLEDDGGDYKIYGATGFLQKVEFYTEEQEYISIVKDGAGVGRVLLCDAYSSVLGTLDIIRTIEENDLRFLYELLQKMRFERYVSGSTIPHIYFKDYSKAKFLIPHPDEQKRISSFAQKLDLRLEVFDNLTNDSVMLKQSLLQKMFV